MDAWYKAPKERLVMKDFAKKLLSRKFLLAVAGFCTALANGETLAAVGIIIAYLGAQGYVDGQSQGQ